MLDMEVGNSATGSVATSRIAPYTEASNKVSHGARQAGREPATSVLVGAMRHRSKRRKTTTQGSQEN